MQDNTSLTLKKKKYNMEGEKLSMNETEENNGKGESSCWYKERAERNRERALLLKKSKVVARPCAKEENSSETRRVLEVQGRRVIDSGGGFLIQNDERLEQEMLKIINDPAPIVVGLPTCLDCQKTFEDSYLLQKFNYSVCNSCRDNSGEHSLITKTRAKDEYLLKDCDLDKREPPLEFIVAKNPRDSNWGDMKLYLRLQVEKRALEVWGSEENLSKEKEARIVKRRESKIKKMNEKVKRLRMELRSSMYDRTKQSPHVHIFGQDTYNEEDDTYTRTCADCGYDETYEKM